MRATCSPDFTLTLIRTPFLPPRYASFWVPLNFNKLDMKDYLKRVYNVDVLKVRSYIEQQKITREKPRGRDGFGPWRRPMSRKKMTVEMTEPFVWPEEPTDTKPYVFGPIACLPCTSFLSVLNPTQFPLLIMLLYTKQVGARAVLRYEEGTGEVPGALPTRLR